MEKIITQSQVNQFREYLLQSAIPSRDAQTLVSILDNLPTYEKNPVPQSVQDTVVSDEKKV